MGISNWPQSLIAEYIALTEESGGVRPTAAQYQYNVLARSAEKEFIPFLRQNGIRFVAFSPLAGGFLTEQGVRFKEGNPVAAGYRRWYIQPGMVAAVEKLTKVCAQYSLPLSEAALRWLAYHSALREEDGILIGASKVAQVENAVRAVAAGPLPAGLAEEMDLVWELCREDAESFASFT